MRLTPQGQQRTHVFSFGMLRVGQLFTKPAEAGFFSSAPGCTAGGPASVAVAHHPGTGPARMLPSLRAPRVVVTRPAPGHLGTSIRAARPERITLHWRARPDPRPRRRRLWVLALPRLVAVLALPQRRRPAAALARPVVLVALPRRPARKRQNRGTNCNLPRNSKFFRNDTKNGHLQPKETKKAKTKGLPLRFFRICPRCPRQKAICPRLNRGQLFSMPTTTYSRFFDLSPLSPSKKNQGGEDWMHKSQKRPVLGRWWLAVPAT